MHTPLVVGLWRGLPHPAIAPTANRRLVDVPRDLGSGASSSARSQLSAFVAATALPILL